MPSKLTAGSAGTWIGSPALSLFHFGEKVLMYATRSARCWAVSALHEGILELTSPRSMAFAKSSSVGKVPVGVDRHLKVAVTKFRGRMFKYGAFSPLPSPRKPWQPQQYRK